MLFHDLKEPGASVYIQQYAFAVRGRFDMRKLDAAWMLTLQRIPSLRTSFHWEGLSKPLQAVHAKVDYRFHHEDLRALPPDGQEKDCAALWRKTGPGASHSTDLRWFVWHSTTSRMTICICC